MPRKKTRRQRLLARALLGLQKRRRVVKIRLPARFFDLASAHLLTRPEPQYEYAKIVFRDVPTIVPVDVFIDGKKVATGTPDELLRGITTLNGFTPGAGNVEITGELDQSAYAKIVEFCERQEAGPKEGEL